MATSAKKRGREECAEYTGVGADGACVCGAKELAFSDTRVDSRSLVEPSGAAAGTMDEFAASRSSDGALLRQLRNTTPKARVSPRVPNPCRQETSSSRTQNVRRHGGREEGDL